MSIRKKLLIAVAIVSVVAVTLLAQVPAHTQRSYGPGFAHSARMWTFLAWHLDMDDSQIAILKEAREAAQPYTEQLKEQHQAMKAAVESGASDAELQTLADATGDIVGQVVGVYAKALARLHTTLTLEQKEKAAKLHDRAADFKDWIGRHR